MFHARHLRWADVDPATHPFDAASVEAALAAALGGARAKDHRRQEAHASAVLVRTVGLWTVGWAWSQSDGGPAIDRAREALIPDVMRALQSWRDYIEEMAAVFATLPREDDLVTALQRAAARVLPLVVARTDANDAWYATLSSALSWYVDHAQLATDDLHTAIADATRYEFSSWIAPEDDVATTAIDNVARRVVAPPASRDALEAWLVARANAFQYLTPVPPRVVVGDGHTRFIETVERARDPERADRMTAALLLVRDSARRQMRLSFDQLAEWHAVVIGTSTPSPLRTTDAFAKGGRERYGARTNLAELVQRALDDLYATDVPFPARVARLYLDICFLHPFADGNARAARLAIDHALSSSGYAIQEAAPLFVLARSADDVPGAWAFAAAVDLLVGPKAP